MSADGLHPGELSGETVLPPGRFFRAEQFACKDGSPYPPNRLVTWIRLRDLCDFTCERWARLIGREPSADLFYVVSGYRSPAYNDELIRRAAERGSHQVASGSLHVAAEAVDLEPVTGGDASALHRMILRDVEDFRKMGLNGLGLYPKSGWVHMDVRPTPPDGHLARWLGT